MNTNKLFTFALSLFLLAGCMPDSFTKFKENPPAKKTTSGGTTGSSSSSSSSSSGTTVVNTVWTEFAYKQTDNDEIIIKVLDATGFSAGQMVYSSKEIYQPVAYTGKGFATVSQVDTTNKLIVLTVNGTPAVYGSYFEANDYINACNSGYNGCGVGTTSATQVVDVWFNLDSTGFNRAPSEITNGIGTITYLAPDLPPGIRIDATTGVIYAPAPPFTVPELSETSYTISSYQTDYVTDGYEDNFITTNLKFSSFNFTQTYNYDVYYEIADNSLIRLEVGSVTGLNIGDSVQICPSALYASCDQDSEINARGLVYFVDSAKRYVYLTMQNAINTNLGTHHRIRRTDYIHKNDGSFSTVQINYPTRLYTLQSAPVLTRNYGTGNIPVSPATEYFDLKDSSIIPAGVLNPTNGTMTFPVMSSLETTDIEVLLYESAGGATAGKEVIRIAFTQAPTASQYGVSALNLRIGEDPVTLSTQILGGTSGTFKFSLCPTLTGSCLTTLPAGLSLDSNTGEMTGIVAAYDSGTNYTVYSYHPDTTNTYFDSYTINIASATAFDNFYYQQSSGTKLIITVDDASAFSAGDDLTNESGGVASIDYVDVNNNELFVTIGATNLTGKLVFKDTDNLDNSLVYAFQKAKIVGNVTHIFDKSTDLTGGIPVALYRNGSPVSVAAGESLNFIISPTLNPDMSFSTTTGAIAGTSASGITPFDKRSYRITATNSIGTVVQTTYDLSVVENPSDLALGLMQILRVGATSRFNIGQRIATSSGTKGRVLDIVSGQALVVSAESLVNDGEGIDNVAFYVAPETTKQNYTFLYVDDTPGVAAVGYIATPAGAKGYVESVYSGGTYKRLYVRVISGSFSEGELVDYPGVSPYIYATKKGTITNVNRRQFASTILNLGTAAAFEIGSYITSQTTSGVGLVVFKDSNKVYVQVISGYFSQGDSVDNANPFVASETTVSSVKGPNVKVATTGAHGFVEGSNLTAFNGTYQAAGTVLTGSTGTTLYTSLEDGIIESGDGLDDVNPFVASAATVAGGINSVNSDATLYLYSGEQYYFPIYLKGTYTNITIDPDLPLGLSIDKTTAVISGIPTEPQPRTTYTLTARNGGSFQSYAFDIVVNAQFRVIQSTAQASSYLMHKEGQGFKTTACRITSDQIDNFSSATDGVNNINCRLEAEENDLNFYGATFTAVTSPGMCEYVRYKPFAYYAKPAGTTRAFFSNYTFTGDPTLCSAAPTDAEVSTPSGAAPYTWVPTEGTGGGFVRNWGETYCTGGDCFNGGDLDNITTPGCGFNYDDGLKCDDGYNLVKNVTCTEASGVCSCIVTEDTVSCGGSKEACIDGPRNDLNKDKTYPLTNTGEITDTFAGTSLTYILKDKGSNVPSTGSKDNNVYHSNWVSGNQCINADGYTYNSNTWSTYVDEEYLPSGFPYPVSPYSEVSKYYTFECLDAAQDVKARINIQIRDWDRKFTTSNSIDLLNVGSPMDDLTTSCFGSLCDNARDGDAISRSQDDTTSLVSYSSCGTPTAGNTSIGTSPTIQIRRGFNGAATNEDLRGQLGPGSLLFCNDTTGLGTTYEPFVVREVLAGVIFFETTARADMDCDAPYIKTGRHTFFINP